MQRRPQSSTRRPAASKEFKKLSLPKKLTGHRSPPKRNQRQHKDVKDTLAKLLEGKLRLEIQLTKKKEEQNQMMFQVVFKLSSQGQKKVNQRGQFERQIQTVQESVQKNMNPSSYQKIEHHISKRQFSKDQEWFSGNKQQKQSDSKSLRSSGKKSNQDRVMRDDEPRK